MGQISTMPEIMEHHRKELIEESAIDPSVIQERGYLTVGRPDQNEAFGIQQKNGFRYHGGSTRDFLSSLGFPSWATREDYFYPGLWIPQYSPRGVRYSGQWKPKLPVGNRDGKRMKYTSAKGNAVRLDVHPRWTRDRGQDDAALLPWINTVDRRLWITEGVKKADSLTSRDEVTVALSGVFNWRNSHGTLGDWEDVTIKGREVVICFDADALVKAQVAQAMARLGKWLKHKGAAKVWYCVTPGEVNGAAVKGVDDYFAAGGSVKGLEQVFSTRPPRLTSTEDAWTDARLAETMAGELLDGAYLWAAGLDWLAYDGRRYEPVHEVTVLEAVRVWVLAKFAEAAQDLKEGKDGAAAAVDGWKALLSANRAKTVLSLARGVVESRASDFDADPDLLNTPAGVVHLPSGEVMPHSAELLLTKITAGSYRPGYTHPDWDRALTVLPPETSRWMQVRIGQAITGHTTPDGIVPILKGGGENGKGLLLTDGVIPALGGYASAASPKLLTGGKNEHSTEMADLRGQRLVIAEELTEGRSINVTDLKRIADVGRIKARLIRKDNIEFDTSHSLFATTNYQPIISETDHGTWRRLAMVIFPYTYVKPGQPLETDTDRRGDPTLKARIKASKGGQHDAAVTWAVEGAMAWYANMREIEAGAEVASVLLPPEEVAEATRAWRREADRVLGFWDAHLDPDPMGIVSATEITESFNRWLFDAGHTVWSRETFNARFRDHQETKRHRVTRRDRVRLSTLPGTLSRGASHNALRAVPERMDVWIGVKFRKDENSL